MMANIDPFYFSLWASRRRMGYAKVGYYSTQPFYQPPALGDVMSEPREVITEDDYGVADSIDGCVQQIPRRLAIALEIWEGAYPDAPVSRSQRCKERGVKYDACRKASKRAKNKIEQLMYG